MNTDLNIAGAARIKTAAASSAVEAVGTQNPKTDRVQVQETPAAPKVSAEQMMRDLQEAIQHINEELRRNGRELNFSMDKVIDYPVVTVRNSNTGEVIRQIPNETTLRVAHNLAELKGLFHNLSA